MTRPDHLWSKLWETMGKNVKVKERQKWSHEKSSTRLRTNITKEFISLTLKKKSKKTSRMLVRNWKTAMALAMPCKISKNNQNCGNDGKSNKINQKLACILEADESTRIRMGKSLPNHHEDQIAGKGDNSLQYYNLVHKFILVPQVMKIPAAKATVDKEWEN